MSKDKKKSSEDFDGEKVDLGDESLDIDAPESDGDDADHGRKRGSNNDEEEKEGTEAEEKAEAALASEAAAPSDKKGCPSSLQISPAETPLLGYALASFVFFLAAVGKKRPGLKTIVNDSGTTGFSSDMSDDLFGIDDISIDNWMGDIFTDLFETADAITSSYDDLCGNMGYGNGKLRNSYYAYALSLGIIGMLLAFGVIGWMKYNASVAAKRKADSPFLKDLEENSASSEDARIDNNTATDDDDTNKSVSELFLDNHKWLINAFFFLWALIGWAIFTFGADGVFAYTGNGFFALWAMMLFSIWNLGVTKDTVTDQARNSDSWIHAMSLASIITIIELTEGGSLKWQYQSHKGIASYAVSVAVIALVFGLVVVGLSLFGNNNSNEGNRKLDRRVRLWSLLVLLVLWTVAACLTTFIGPFLATGNGYFAVWGSVICTGIALMDAQNEMQEDV